MLIDERLAFVRRPLERLEHNGFCPPITLRRSFLAHAFDPMRPRPFRYRPATRVVLAKGLVSLIPEQGHDASRPRQTAVFADDAHGQLERLFVVETRVDGCLVGPRQVVFVEFSGAANAFGDILAGQFQMHAAEA